MKSIKQNRNTNCGQTTVAMLAGVTIEESEKVYGHGKTSNIREAKKALKELGFEAGATVKVDNRKRWSLPTGKAFIRIKYGKRNCGHFMAQDNDGTIYDPNGKVYKDREEMLKDYNSRYSVRTLVSHYFTVTETEDLAKAGE
jgi:hypothetical protein